MSCVSKLAQTVSILLLMAATSIVAEEFSYEYQRIVEVDGSAKLEINNVRGRVSIIGGEENRLIIEATKYIRAASEEEALMIFDHIEIKVDQSGNSISVSTNYLPLVGGGNSFWHNLLGSGADTYGDVEYRIVVPMTTDVSISGVATDIAVSSVEGRLDINNETGNTVGEFLVGPITVKQPYGKIDFQWVDGDIRIKSSNGEITVNQVRGALDITTLTSDVHVQTELNTSRDFFVNTSSGSVTFSVPELSSGKLHIETASGQISTDVPIAIESMTRHTLKGEFGAGGPRIKITSSTGDVRIAQF